jgi:hypothetical protein
MSVQKQKEKKEKGQNGTKEQKERKRTRGFEEEAVADAIRE